MSDEMNKVYEVILEAARKEQEERMNIFTKKYNDTIMAKGGRITPEDAYICGLIFWAIETHHDIVQEQRNRKGGK